MTIPLEFDKLQQMLIGSLRNRFANQRLPHVCFRRISPQRVLVSRFVATIGRAFRSLWRESDMGGQIKRRSTLQLIMPGQARSAGYARMPPSRTAAPSSAPALQFPGSAAPASKGSGEASLLMVARSTP